MINKTKIIGMLIFLFAGIFWLTLSYKKVKNSNLNDFEYAIHKVDNGFGYTISSNGKILIKQDQIPAIQTIMPFCSPEDAQKVAEVVIDKIYATAKPIITMDELRLLGIKNCF